jgi:MoaA/NifB/PqqE/SkfB family radical SAM enzyme
MTSLTSKVDINLGYACNAKCPFCYYYESVTTNVNQRNLSTNEAKAILRQAKKFNLEEVEFTGGEVSLRKDFVELVAYAKKDLGFKVVSMVTNGILLVDYNVIQALSKAGLDDILFSVHGHTAEIHDQLTATKGSFRRILTAIDHANALGIRTRANTVICQANYKHIEEIFELLIAHNLDNINLVMFNPVIQAINLEVVQKLYVSYAESSQQIKQAIDRYQSVLPHLNIRYLPFCYMVGYERYVTNLDQFNFEPDEWNNYFSFRLRKGRWLAWGASLLGILYTPYKKVALSHGIRGLFMAGMGRFYALKDKYKSKKCHACAYVKVCDYVWKNYYNIYGDDELNPVPGVKVNHPAWCITATQIREPGALPSKAPTIPS